MASASSSTSPSSPTKPSTTFSKPAKPPSSPPAPPAAPSASHPRNMTDDMIRDLAKHGGVIQINYHVGFLSQEFRDFEEAHPEAEKEINEEVKKRCGDNEACRLTTGDQVVRDFMQAGKLPKVDWTVIVDQIH